MFSGRRKVLNSNNTLQHGVGVRVLGGHGDDTWAIDQVDSLHQSDVLPDFRLSRNRSDRADLLLLERVDDTRFTNIWVSDESDGDLLLVRVKDGELSQQLDQGSFTKRVVDTGVTSDSRGRKRKMLDPSCLPSADVRLDRTKPRQIDEMSGQKPRDPG